MPEATLDLHALTRDETSNRVRNFWKIQFITA